MIEELPNDYESCGECGYDHSYEYEEAHTIHMKIEREFAKEGKNENV